MRKKASRVVNNCENTLDGIRSSSPPFSHDIRLHGKLHKMGKENCARRVKCYIRREQIVFYTV